MSKHAPRFIHLRVHTEHSLLEGAVPVKKLVKLCAEAQMPAVAVTDSNNMFAALEFSVTAQGAGVQPIVGCQISVEYDPAQPGEKLRLPAVSLEVTGAGSGAAMQAALGDQLRPVPVSPGVLVYLDQAKRKRLLRL